MNLFDRLVGYFAPEQGLRRRRARTMLQRAYEGAARTDGWRPRRAGASANTDHRADARELRIRARSLVQNVPYLARALHVLVSAMIGTGITPRSLSARKEDREALDQIVAEWAPVADADGAFDLFGLQAAAYRAMVQDGEVLVRRRTRRPDDNLPIPLQLQLLEIDWLDSDKQGPVVGGGQIINGIEYDPLGRVRNYWLFDQHPGERTRLGRLSSRAVSAKDIIHLYAPARPGQGRGITRFAPVIARSRDLMLYEDAELQRKNLETRLGVLVSGDIEGLANPPEHATLSSDGKGASDLGALPSGGITQLPPGMNIERVEPKPSSDFVQYCALQLHIIAAGLGVPYESMTGDMHRVNFSSARIRQIEFRRDIEQEQWLVVIPVLCTGIWRWVVDAAVLAGRVRRADYKVDHSTPRWDYVNPLQDVKAEREAISGGLLSPSEALRRRGYKPEQVFEEMGRDLELLRKSGALDLMSFLSGKGDPAAPEPPGDAGDET